MLIRYRMSENPSCLLLFNFLVREVSMLEEFQLYFCRKTISCVQTKYFVWNVGKKDAYGTPKGTLMIIKFSVFAIINFWHTSQIKINNVPHICIKEVFVLFRFWDHSICTKRKETEFLWYVFICLAASTEILIHFN